MSAASAHPRADMQFWVFLPTVWRVKRRREQDSLLRFPANTAAVPL